MVLRHVIKGKHLKDEIAFRNRDYEIKAEEQTGGNRFYLRKREQITSHREKTNYGGVTDAGAIFMYLYSFDAMEMVPLASPDIQPLNGVVHALNYNYVLGKI